MRQSGNRFLMSPTRASSTSATAISLRFLLAVSEPMSEPAMPLAPKLACRTVSLGAALACNRHTNGAANVAAAADLSTARRVIFDMTGSGEIVARLTQYGRE